MYLRDTDERRETRASRDVGDLLGVVSEDTIFLFFVSAGAAAVVVVVVIVGVIVVSSSPLGLQLLAHSSPLPD